MINYMLFDIITTCKAFIYYKCSMRIADKLEGALTPHSGADNSLLKCAAKRNRASYLQSRYCNGLILIEPSPRSLARGYTSRRPNRKEKAQ